MSVMIERTESETEIGLAITGRNTAAVLEA